MQARSRRTLDSLLGAADELLHHKSFEAITVSELVRAAGVSTGAFYGRFAAKDELLPGLYAQYLRWLDEECERELAQARWVDLDLGAGAHHAADLICRLIEARPWLLRAMAIYARRAVGQAPQTPPVQQRLLNELGDRLLETLPASERPARALVDFAVYAAITVAREWTLFPELPMARSLRLDGGQLRTRIAAMLIAGLSPQRSMP